MPVVSIGRLAVDQQYQGRGLGKALLADAAMKAITAPRPRLPCLSRFLVPQRV
ncbi:GNAT family N-acetyltransferase [Methylovulum sp.]|uniref:GNAT family N-acetyltransferase n=1 Tax=Methylovulum sp. TaxID=1916980 RepID=UPI0034263088